MLLTSKPKPWGEKNAMDCILAFSCSKWIDKLVRSTKHFFSVTHFSNFCVFKFNPQLMSVYYWLESKTCVTLSHEGVFRLIEINEKCSILNIGCDDGGYFVTFWFLFWFFIFRTVIHHQVKEKYLQNEDRNLYVFILVEPIWENKFSVQAEKNSLISFRFYINELRVRTRTI